MKSTLWTVDEAARAISGRISGRPWEATGVAIDSRALTEGDLFVALPGERSDGHDYVAAALAKGAAAALVEYSPKDVANDAPLLIVEDVLQALVSLAAAARSR